MNPWAARRKGVIFLLVLVCAVIIVGVPTYFLLKDEPDCFNRIEDGDESGVDCGGSCQLLCVPETLPPIARGEARLLKIATTTYVVVIPVENPNINGQVSRAAYTFKIYSNSSIDPIKTFNRETYIGRAASFALFEGPFDLPTQGSYRAVFEWGPNLVWEKSKEDLPMIVVENVNFISTPDGKPRIEATLTNKAQKTVNNVEAVVLLSDINGNTVGAGKTFVDSISPGDSQPISFSWPEAFLSQVVSTKILPHPLPDKSFVK